MTSGINPGIPYVEPVVETEIKEDKVVLPEMKPVLTDDAVAVISDRLSDSLPPSLIKKLEDAGITAEDRKVMAQAVVDGQNSINEGDPLGTIREDATTGKYYIRVSRGGIHQWKIVDPEIGEANDFDMSEVAFPIIVEVGK